MRIGEKELRKSGENTVVVKRINNDINGNGRYKLSYFIGKEHVKDTILQAYSAEDAIEEGNLR